MRNIILVFTLISNPIFAEELSLGDESPGEETIIRCSVEAANPGVTESNERYEFSSRCRYSGFEALVKCLVPALFKKQTYKDLIGPIIPN